ncbi:nucleoside-triphosphatase [Melioribacteraceae bacterium 4301-Me]|uniref:nucleoside-triphosphatase n=1 Tax=Pyranulibacter aquaticus TaxID=3163344 RepID=UPI003598B4B0
MSKINNIYIYTGKIGTGKTTRLLQWASAQKNIDGILQPLIEGKRYIYHLSTKTLKPLETNETSNSYKIGKYFFNKDTFDWAKIILNQNIRKNLNWLIIDEVGPLELNGNGLEPLISELIYNKKIFVGKIVLVIRESILEKAIKHYKLADKYKFFNEII